jgi:cytochrome c-type biogenesis protein CcmH/NrfF
VRTGLFIPFVTLATLCSVAGAAYAQAPPVAVKSPPADTGKTSKSKSSTPPTTGRLDPVTRRVRQMSDELRSPFCPGKTIMTCTSYQAFELRREIEAMVRSGMTDAEILKKLKTVHGDDISNPKQPWYTFFVPFLPFIVLGGLIFWIVRRWRTRGQETELGGADLESHPTYDTQPVDEDRRARLRARVKNNQD